MKQKEIFTQSEGDAWYLRNKQGIVSRKLPDDHELLKELLQILPQNTQGIKILEIGCGDGSRLSWLKNQLNLDCYGIDPSAQAVQAALNRGVNALQSTADKLPFDNQYFDIVIFGFCLYLCDRDDLFLIASEANRVLNNPGWIMIVDFFSETPKVNSYHHKDGINSYKMDYRSLFSWHPHFECMTHKIRHHATSTYTDEQDEWVAVSVLRKMSL